MKKDEQIQWLEAQKEAQVLIENGRVMVIAKGHMGSGYSIDDAILSHTISLQQEEEPVESVEIVDHDRDTVPVLVPAKVSAA